jgi:SpoIID/LytB domain protein
VVAAAALTSLSGVLGTSAAQAAEVYPLPTSGSITVTGNGNGHGHGMSQYGARGAAIAGLSAAQIVAFYYPHTTLATISAALIRVYLPSAGGDTCIRAAAGLTATGVGALSTAGGVTRFRLVPSGSGLALQRGTGTGCTGAGWSNYHTGLPAQVDVSSSQGFVHLYRSDGTSTDYRGSIGALRSGNGELTINRVSLDDYAMGVAPREMPASWQPAAVQAQAIAARSYGEYAREHSAGSPYDICDTDQCQVYGGMTHYDAAGTVLWTDDPAAVVGNTNMVIQYQGATAFTQFSASDGGWTVDGGQPYLIAQADPYDNSASGDPYLGWTETVPVSQIAAYYGLATATSVVITSRDGNGMWGGRVLAGQVVGTTRAGAATTVATTGFGLQAAMGLPHNWFTINPAVPSPPTGVTASVQDSATQVSWAPPASPGSAPISGYSVTVGSQTVTAGSSARAASFKGLTNGVPTTVVVRALSPAGAGVAATVAVTPTASPQGVQALTPVRIFDSRINSVLIDPTHPLLFNVPGHAGIPATPGAATSVQFALTIISPSAAGTLRVSTAGTPIGGVVAIAYRPGRTITAMVSVPTLTSQVVQFLPSSGSLALVADAMSYSGPHLSRAASVPPVRIGYLPRVPVGAGTALTVRGVAGVPGTATGVVLSVAGGPARGSGWLRLWPDGTAIPTVSQVVVTPDGSGASTVIVPIGADGKVRIGASTSAIGAQVTVVGYLAPGGTGLLETTQPSGVADTVYGRYPSVTVRAGAVTRVALRGRAPIPAAGVQAVLVQLTVSRATTYGSLYAFAAGTARPTAPTSTYPGAAAGSSTAAALVHLGAGGAISLAASAGAFTVSIDVIGYLTGS